MWRIPALLVLSAVPVVGQADDWPQWMGPNRDGVWSETGILDQFPENGLTKLWSAPVHAGYSGPAVANGRVFLLDRQMSAKHKLPDNPFDDKTQVPGSERVIGFNSVTGQKLWEQAYPCEYRVSFGLGPRCTPTVDGEHVYTLGTMGDLKCLKAQTGEVVWQTNFCRDHQAKPQHWGFCGHPLVYQNLLIVLAAAPDGLVMAFDKLTGKPVWRALETGSHGQAGYSPPTLVRIGDVPTLLQFHPTGISSLEPTSGKLLWTVPMKPKYEMSIMAPQLRGNLLFVAGAECGLMLEVQPGQKPVELWRCNGRQLGVHPVNMTPLLDNECLFGVCHMGAMRGVDLRTGKRLWESYLPTLDTQPDPGFRGLNSATAFLVRHGERYFSFNELGTLRILKLNANGMTTLSQTKLMHPTSNGMGRKVLWSHPAFANKCIYVRNDQELACFSLAK